MLPVLALFAVTAVEPIVSTEWLQAHLSDDSVRIICVADGGEYARAHIPSARVIGHMDTVGEGHVLAEAAALAKTFTKAGAADGTHIVLYGENPMATGWVYMALASIGHGGDVSMLDGGIRLWESEKRPTSTTRAAPGTGTLTVRPAPDVIVDAGYVRNHLQSPGVRVLDVRSTEEWNNGHLPGAAPVLWPDLFADLETLKFKSRDEMRAVLARAGVAPNQEVITYCAVGMRASLMYFAARAVGIPARVYVGSYQDWIRDSTNPVVR